MKWIIITLLSVIFLAPTLSSGQDISSVYPDPAIIGGPVSIIGGPFAATDRIVIGGQVIVPRLLDERQLVFIIPQLDIGVHSLYIQTGEREMNPVFSLQVILPTPRINSLEPSNIAECSTVNERVVSLQGNHFQPGIQLLLDDQIVPSTRLSDSEIEFSVPHLEAGIYGVKVVNPDEGESLPHSLWLNNIPHIYDVSRGEDYISTYQLIIYGKNFAHNSSLIVYEYPVGQTDLPPRQKVVRIRGDASSTYDQNQSLDSESLIYIDCNTLIYNRYPYVRQDRKLVLRVGSPDGKQTESYELYSP